MKSRIRLWQRNLHTWAVENFFIRSMEERAELFAQHFEDFLTPKSHILDIGGAWGFYFDPLCKRGHYLTVLDVAKSRYHRAPTVIYNPADPFPFLDQSVDASFLITMLHHTPDPSRLLEEAKRVTRGVIVVVSRTYRSNAAAPAVWCLGKANDLSRRLILIFMLLSF